MRIISVNCRPISEFRGNWRQTVMTEGLRWPGSRAVQGAIRWRTGTICKGKTRPLRERLSRLSEASLRITEDLDLHLDTML